MEKFEIDLKWASYFIIVNAIVVNVITLFAVILFSVSFEDRQSKNNLSIILVILFLIQLFYFVRKAIKENKKYQKIRAFAKVSIFFRVLGLYLIINCIINQSSESINPWHDNYILEYRRSNLSEFLIDEDDIKANTSNWLNDLVIAIKGRLGE